MVHQLRALCRNQIWHEHAHARNERGVQALRRSVNALWPKKIIATAAVEFEFGGEDLMRSARTPAIMVDIAHVILTRRARSISGQLLLDEDVLRTSGEIDFGRYQDGRDSNELRTDLFVED